MKHFIQLVLIIVLSLISFAIGQDFFPEENIELLRAGQFHGNEVQAKSGEGWYGLFEIEDHFELKAVSITVEAVPDFLSGNPDDRSGKSVTVDHPGKPLFLLKGWVAPHEGRINSVFSGYKFIYPGERISLKLGDDNYFSVSAFGEAVHLRGDTRLKNYTLQIEKAADYQVIAKYDAIYIDGAPSIIWAGDLDCDGKLDLLMDLRDHYNVTEYTLFLSSRADEGKMVKKCAVFRTVGC